MEFEKKRKQKQKTTPYYESLPISAKALCDRVLKLEDIKPNVLVHKKWNSTKKKKKTKTKTRPLRVTDKWEYSRLYYNDFYLMLT
jgi:hypothetical protein